MASKNSEDSLLEAEDEKRLLQLIKNRFSQDQVYNFIDDVAVSINPCRSLPDESWKLCQTADRAIHHLRLHQKNQCIVLMGDSGSGKTENAKKFMGRIINSVSTLGENLAKNITQAGVVLESFGNACTSTCDNASRYIRLTELLFTQDIKLKGAYIHHYLLEKTRVAQHDKVEENFHIFYQFLIGMSDEDLEKYEIQKSVQHRYIGHDFDWTRDQEKFQDELNKVTECFRSLGFSQDNLDTIFRILAAILHIGDLTFAINIKEKKAGVVQIDPLRKASQLLRVSPEKLEFSLVTELTHVKGKVARRLRRVNEIDEARDKLAMALYGRMFAWIVWKINRYLTPIHDEKSDENVISVLDPFGFEKLELNGMEQLCINTTNEHLSYLYNQCVFAWEMEDQETEGILIQKVDYMNNKDVVDFLMERPQGIFAVIDHHAKTIHGTDSKLVKKLNSKHCKHACYEEVSNCPYPVFTISHYAGKVTYTALNMLNRNKNMLGGSIILCLQDSADDLLQRLFMVKLSPTGAISTADGHVHMEGIKAMPRKAEIKKMRGTVRRKTEMIGNIQGFTKSKQSKEKMIQEQAHLTLTSQLRNSLSDLVQRFLKSDLHFVRCIRPNHQLIPYHFDDELVKAQLKYSSVMETVLMRQQGFPVRVAFGPFINRYKILAYRLTMDVKYVANTCEKILWSISGLEWKVAKTKVFMKNSCREKLENKLRKTHQGIIIMQKLFRGRLARRWFRVLRFQKERELAIVKDFLSKVEKGMNIVYNHLCNQVTEEDGRSKPNISKVALHVNHDQIKEKALNILKGNKEKKNKKNSSSQQPSLDSRKDWPKSSTPDTHVRDESATNPNHDLSMIEALDLSTLEVTQTSNLDQKSDVETDEEPESPQATGELSPDGAPLVSISDIFESDPVSPVTSPTTTSQSDDASDKDLCSPEPNISITDIFSNENIDMDLENSPEVSSEEETPAEQSITDVFNDTPTDVTIDVTMTTSPECDTSQDRPMVVGRESNLSTVSFESTMSKDTDDDIVKVAMESPGLWCNITCYERDISRGEFRVDRPVIIVDGSSNAFDVTRIGIGSMPMTPGDDKVEKVRRCVGKGIKLTMDEDGDMWVKRCSKNNVFVKGHHLSPEVVAVKGVLPKGQLLKIFDFESFADYIQYECDPKRYEPGKSEELLASTKVCICFVKDADQDTDAPCWIEVEMAEPSRLTKVALELAKEIRRHEREKSGDRTPPILRAKIGKFRKVITVETWKKKVRPRYYIDSFKYRRRGWARKNVSVNPFDFGSQSHLEKSKADNPRLRTQSSPEELESVTRNDEFGAEVGSDDVFEASGDQFSALKVGAEDDSFVTSESTSKSKILARANTEGQILSQGKTVEVGAGVGTSKSKLSRANTEGQILNQGKTVDKEKKVWAKELHKASQETKKKGRAKTTS